MKKAMVTADKGWLAAKAAEAVTLTDEPGTGNSSSPAEKTPIFSLEKIAPHPTGSGGMSWLKADGDVICQVCEWCFASCAVNAFQSFGYKYDWWTTENIDALMEWLKHNAGVGVWKPREFYFCITNHQKNALTNLVTHPKVSLKDQFINKAHGEATMYLYRLSF
jgi:hypothetical protein